MRVCRMLFFWRTFLSFTKHREFQLGTYKTKLTIIFQGFSLKRRLKDWSIQLIEKKTVLWVLFLNILLENQTVSLELKYNRESFLNIHKWYLKHSRILIRSLWSSIFYIYIIRYNTISGKRGQRKMSNF